ncbi:HNH endonuclease family protein [soil metagenome]
MGTRRRTTSAAAAAVVLASLLVAGCSGASDGSPDGSPDGHGRTASSAPDDDRAARVQALLVAARVIERQPDVPGYDRDCGPGDGCVFGTAWSDDTDAPQGHNGCDTRNDVLAASLTEVAFKAGSDDCDVVAGLLVDPYTGTSMDYATEGSQIHVDHLFPLAAAWDLGASTWPLARRARFANDTAYELIAVQGTANLQKSDSTPASWLPPNKPYRCAYVTAYLEVADAYDLAVTAADVRVIEAVVRKSC